MPIHLSATAFMLSLLLAFGVTPFSANATNRLTASDFTYLGAFRLPGDETRPQTFAYGGNAMTFNPDGDPTNADAYPGSLFIMGHDRIAFGGLPNGNQIAEVSIPQPLNSRNLADLPQASFIQNFQDVLANYFHDMDEIPKVGMAYLNHPATGPKIHLTWGQHLQPENAPSQGWFNPTLTASNFQGVWFIGEQNLYSVNGYLFEIPAAWADAYAQGRYLATGRMRDGGQGGMGPALFAYRPWLSDGAAAPSGTRLAETPLLLYENAYNTDQIVRAMHGYQHPDEWEGGAWITTTSGRSALLFAGSKSNGVKYWYGYINALGSEYPCVDQHITDFVTCRLANGAACPAGDFTGCCNEALGNCASYRGWWSTRFDAQFILYDPADLARVASGEIESWQPQPYAALDIDQYLYLNPPVWDEVNVGKGDQRRYRVGDVAYDRARHVLYVLEQLADGGKPVVHVWQVSNGGAVSNDSAVGVFRNGAWYLDGNGNGLWDGCTQEGGQDFCLFNAFGMQGDLPTAGHWDGGTKSHIGVLRSGTGEWFLDRNGNRQWDGCIADSCYSGFGSPGDLPVAGDWNGTGFAKIGVFRNGQWYLDNGNGAWDGCGTELCLSFGQSGDLPVAGSWDGGLKAGVGVFRAGTWYLDYNGNGAWDGCGADRCYFNSFGQEGDLPAAGDWNGDGKANVGVFRAGTWYLDYNGNGAWDGCNIDRCYVGSFGQQGDWPVAGKW